MKRDPTRDSATASLVRPDAAGTRELAELVALRSVADPRQFPPEECARAAQWVLETFADVGFADVRLVRDGRRQPGRGGSRPGPDPDAPTVLLYAHYDVQPPLDERPGARRRSN